MTDFLTSWAILPLHEVDFGAGGADAERRTFCKGFLFIRDSFLSDNRCVYMREIDAGYSQPPFARLHARGSFGTNPMQRIKKRKSAPGMPGRIPVGKAAQRDHQVNAVSRNTAHE